MSNHSPLRSSGPPIHDIPAEIRAQMARQGVSQVQLAERTGMTTATLSRRLNAKTPLTVEELGQIAAVLGVRVAHFLTDHSPEQVDGAA